ncbi:Lrp/AsnC ligand binding domain-containing protein [Pseudidiomarina taiwanensis]|uniref:Leucine-responsive regulatory protein n=1 Tax=Pseudidiomarina taiwanensis TaxID=337250 RepID=A0A432ZN65_9GAMM|nr:Lrp/AsnC ligand binding domain-containing protein [Pseudidiomarina taiwanensis]RUO79323.1 leucine-responsive transcriptional regulator [Pseudidiomarina taiwanensis]
MFLGSASEKVTIDRLDRKIIQRLQQDGRIANVALARAVGLSPTACAERVKRLEKAGVIIGYQARIDPNKIGPNLLVFVEITLSRKSSDVFAEFGDAVRKTPEILECHLVAGDFDFLLKARVGDMPSYRKLLGETILMMPGVNESRTYVVMEQIKQETRVQL